jgi:hypothetical protein
MSNQSGITHRHDVVRLLEKYALRFFTLLVIVFCFFLFYFGPQILPGYKEALISVSTSLFASLVFARLYSSIVERHHQAAMNAEIARNVKSAVEEIKQAEQGYIQRIVDHTVAKIEELDKSHYHEISTHFRELIPARSFPPTDKPEKGFNQLLTDELLRSRTYFFKGVTGRYIAARLATARRQNLACKVLLSDPSSKDLLRLYVKDRFGITLSGNEMETRIEQVKREIFMTIIDLFAWTRWTTPVELKLYRGPVFYRTEILDEFFIISFFTSHVTLPTAFPTTYLYKRDSFYYETYLTDFNQAFELADKSIILNSKTTEENLHDFLNRIGCDLSLLPQLREEAEQFRNDFLARTDWQ